MVAGTNTICNNQNEGFKRSNATKIIRLDFMSDPGPFCNKLITELTMRRIIRMYKKGYTVFKIGSKLKIELRAVRNIIRKSQKKEDIIK